MGKFTVYHVRLKIAPKELNVKALIIYNSFTGNTEKIAKEIKSVLDNEKVEAKLIKASGDEDIDLYEYNLIFLGTPVIQFLPSKQIISFIKRHMKKYREKGYIVPKSPKIKEKYASLFVTFSGIHTGIREAIPAIKYMEQFFEHIRFEVLDEIFVIGEYKGEDELNKKGVFGDISGRPKDDDLLYVRDRVKSILEKVIKRESKKLDIHFPESLKFLFSENMEVKEPFWRFRDSLDIKSSLSNRERELIRIALSCFAKCKDCLKFHIERGILEYGLTEKEIKDAIISGFIIGGPPFVHFGYEVLKEMGICD